MKLTVDELEFIKNIFDEAETHDFKQHTDKFLLETIREKIIYCISVEHQKNIDTAKNQIKLFIKDGD